MVTRIFGLLRLTAMFTAAGLAAVEVSVFLITLVHAPEPSIAQQKAGKAEAKTPMDRCMDTWDRAAQMSKQEWKESCKRTIKENPGLYNKSF